MDNPFDDAQPFEALEPSPLMREIPPGAPYPVEALGPLREVAEAIHDMTQAPLAIAAQSVLGVASLAAQALADVEALHGSAPCSLFLLTVAGSGERKTTCDRLAMKPVHEFQRELSDEYREAATAHRNRLDIWEKRRAAILQDAKKEPIAAEADLHALGPAPEGPLSPVIVVTEPTFEGITKSLAFSRPALGIFSDEAGGFLGGHAMNSENRQKTLTGLSGLWDASPVNRARAGDGVATFFGRRMASHLMVQPIAAVGLLSDPLANGQGFLARFLMTEPPSTGGTREWREPLTASGDALERYSARIADMLGAELPLREGTTNELEPPVLTLEPMARERLKSFYNGTEISQGSGGEFESIRAFASKAAEHAARLAGVLTVYAGRNVVTDELMAHAIALARYYLGEALRLSDAAQVSKETADAERLRVWILESWREPYITASLVARYGPNGLRITAYARKLLVILEQHGWLAILEDGAVVLGKKRREAWRISGR